MEQGPFARIPPGRRARYAEVGIEDPRLIFENAEKLTEAIPPDRVFDYLFDHARAPQLPRAAWIRQATLATNIELLLRDFFYHEPPPDLGAMFDPAARAAAERAMASGSGTLALTCHGGFVTPLRHFFNRMIRDGVMIATKARPRLRILDAHDAGSALFGALRALGEGRPVYVAPDGPLGRPAGEIEVLGARCPVADGAPFLAYEAGCETVWYTIRRNGRVFFPHVEPGPSRAPGETFKEFRSRLTGFYRDKIEEQFTGDPQSLALPKPWRNRLRDVIEEAGR